LLSLNTPLTERDQLIRSKLNSFIDNNISEYNYSNDCNIINKCTPINNMQKNKNIDINNKYLGLNNKVTDKRLYQYPQQTYWQKINSVKSNNKNFSSILDDEFIDEKKP
jgi:hypothetical protein